MVIIIGGVLTGLSAAYELSKKGVPVIVIEQDACLGGVLSSFKIKDFEIEKFYHHVFKGDKDFFSLLDELGLSNKLMWKGTKTGFYSRKKFHNLSGSANIISTSLLSYADKARLASLALKLKVISKKNILEMDNISARQWIIGNMGERLYKKFFEPLLLSKYGSNLDDISAAWFVERMRIRSNRGLLSENLGYLKGGFDCFVTELENHIEKMGGKIIKNSYVKKIIISKGRVIGIVHSKGKIKDDCVISTMPPKKFLSISGIRGNYGKKLSKLEYQGSVSVLVGLDKKVSNYYWTNLIDQRDVFGAVVEHTNFIDSSFYNGDRILYMASYPPKNSKIWRMGERKIFDLYFSQLKKIFSIHDSKPLWYRISKSSEAGLIYKKGVLNNMPGFKTPIDGLFIGGMFNSYPERSINESVRIGKECAKLVHEFVSKKV